VPWCQPRVNTLAAKVLAALGVLTEDLVLGGTAYTVVSKRREEIACYFDAHASVPTGEDELSVKGVVLNLDRLRDDGTKPPPAVEDVLLLFLGKKNRSDDDPVLGSLLGIWAFGHV
jgi:hypothetical protein